ncbi:hypothetical protein P7C70_g7641, partial [Phenoliferia sp. Uapishka_3]
MSTKKGSGVKFQHNRVYHEPIGPATPLINPSSFENESAAAMERAHATLEAFDALLDLSNAREQVALRCSVEDLYEECSRLHDDSACQVELRLWHEERLFPSGQGENIDEDQDGGDDYDLEEEDGRKKNVMDGLQRRTAGDRQFAELMKEVNSSSLQILKPIKDIELYLRKTKMPDYNTLAAPREAQAPTTPGAESDSPLSSLLYTITMHPVQRITNRSPFATRTQTLHLLGSTTLWELRENLRAGGESIPAVSTVDSGSDDEMETNSWETGNVKTKWTNERRVAGAVWGIEGVLHSDQEEGKTDYAEMVCSLIDSTSWNVKGPTRQEYDDIDVHGRASGNFGSEVGGNVFGDPTPRWTAGSSMQNTMIGELDIRVGQAYWFMHQGNCEHVWTVDCIRSSRPPKRPSPQIEILDSTIPNYDLLISRERSQVSAV